jgi:hypothetical protein
MAVDVLKEQNVSGPFDPTADVSMWSPADHVAEAPSAADLEALYELGVPVRNPATELDAAHSWTGGSEGSLHKGFHEEDIPEAAAQVPGPRSAVRVQQPDKGGWAL